MIGPGLDLCRAERSGPVPKLGLRSVGLIAGNDLLKKRIQKISFFMDKCQKGWSPSCLCDESKSLYYYSVSCDFAAAPIGPDRKLNLEDQEKLAF